MSLRERMGDLQGKVREAEPRDAVRPTGQQVFDALTADEQDELIGAAAAEKIRAGEATLADFVKRDGDFITQKPVEDV